jgi:hypothetical protein
LAAYLLLTEFGLRHNNIGSFTSNLLYHESFAVALYRNIIANAIETTDTITALKNIKLNDNKEGQ